MSVTIDRLKDSDKADWRRLYDGYAAFYNMPMTDETAERVWGWLHDPEHVQEALVARDVTGRVIGLAHFRAMPSPLRGAYAGFLDDLFVDPEVRGSGAADKLLEALNAIAAERGWPVIRWITADNNYRARGVYDRKATRSMWITYEMKP
jgi:GNAT superfamily N-acetyltransferase